MNYIESVPTETWLQTAQQCPWATFFHTPDWAGLIARAYPEYVPACQGFELADGTLVLLPSVRRDKRRLLARRSEYKSMEPGVYGGFIAPRPLKSEEVSRAAGHLLNRPGTTGRIVESPLMHVPLPAGFSAKKLSTHIIDLRPGYDTIQQRFSRGQKSNIRQAEKKQVCVRQAENLADIDAYYRIYLDTLERWGDAKGSACPQGLLRDLFTEARPQARFWLAEADGRIVAGVLVLSWNRGCIYWHGASLQDYFKWYPNNLLHSRIIAWACGEGYDYYDMGASPGLEGVKRFKESFGADEQTFYSYRWK